MILELWREHYFQTKKHKGEYHLMLLHMCPKILKISLTVQSFRTDTIFILNIPKENNSEIKNGGVMVLVLCLLSDEALYLFQVS